MFCINCKKNLSKINFEPREDRLDSYYKFCKNCMKEQGRSINHPPLKYGGDGNIYPVIVD